MVFIQNKWSHIYDQIITNAKQRGSDKGQLDYYTERHHILPKSLGGVNSTQNLVLLTAKEHFICHHLLTKCVTGTHLYKIKHAFSQMVHCGKFSPTSRHYEKARNFYAEGARPQEWRDAISAARKGYKVPTEQVERMRKRLTGRKLSTSHKENIRLARKKLGMPEQCRRARLKTLVKRFKVVYPDGSEHIIENLKQHCKDTNINHASAANNSKHERPITRGPLKGMNFINLDVVKYDE